MRITVRPLSTWPYEPQTERHATYQVTYQQTLWQLEEEIDKLDGSEVIIGLVVDPSAIRMDGYLRANARPRYPGVELSFEVPGGGRLTFHTDRHRGWADSWQHNLRAITLGLGALRAVDRYGIASSGQQYAGFAQLPANTAASRGQALVAQHGGIREALMATHPDHGGDARDFAAVQAYREAAA